MNQINSKLKQTNLTLIKGMATLSLSLALQAKMCTSRNPVITYTVKQVKGVEFQKEMDSRNDISRTGAGYLHDIVEYGDIQQLKILLKRLDTDKHTTTNNTDLHNAFDDKGNTALIKAIKKGRKDMAQELIKNGYTDCAKASQSKVTPLNAAIDGKLEEVVIALLEKLPAEVLTKADEKGRTALHLLARGNQQKAFKQLYDKISSSGIDDIVPLLFQLDKSGRSVFASAYLPKNAIFGGKIMTGSDDKMFLHILRVVNHKLDDAKREQIRQEIDKQAINKVIKLERSIILRNMVT